MRKNLVTSIILITMWLHNLEGLVTTIDICTHSFFSLNVTSTWREYCHYTPQVNFFKEKWAWASSLTLKSKKPVKLTTLTLQWNGPQIDSLAAGLYQKKERESAVIPIQKNLICDGIWDTSTQQLTFRLDEKIVAVNKYHLLLSYSKQVESHLKSGKFLISDMKTTVIAKKESITLRYDHGHTYPKGDSPSHD